MSTISAVAYARYSSDKQQESSITVQLAAIRKFCATHKIELIKEYVDEAQTGTNANRKQFQEMVKDAPNKTFQMIIVHRMDRWARNVDDARYYKKYFAKYGIKMLSSIEEFDETPEGEFFELMSMGMAELYSKKLSREATAGLLANAREGKIHGGTPPLGYKIKGKYYVIDEKGAEAVRIIFDMTLQGYGYNTIRDFLNSNGYRKGNGELFKGSFTDLLRNRKYIGEYIFNRSAYRARGLPYNNHAQKAECDIIRIPGGMPKIIDEDTFYRVQKILDGRVKNRDSVERRSINGTSENRKFILSGLIRCSECGRSFCGMRGTSNHSPYITYRCSSKGINCPARAINSSYLENYVLNLLCNSLFAPENENRLCELIKAAYIHSYDTLREEYAEAEKQVSECKHDVEEQEQLILETDNKTLKSIAQSGLRELERRLLLKQQDAQILRNQIDTFPGFDRKKIIKSARDYRKKLEKSDTAETQKLLSQCIRVIRIGNEKIETIIDSQGLLGSYIKFGVAVEEKRDSVARRENHHKIAFNIATITTKIT